jgi:hypothetical protein
MRVGGQRHAPAGLPPRKRPWTHCVGGRVGQGQVWIGAVNLAPAGFRCPDRPVRSKSLYRFSYSGPRSHPIIFVLLPALFYTLSTNRLEYDICACAFIVVIQLKSSIIRLMKSKTMRKAGLVARTTGQIFIQGFSWQTSSKETTRNTSA